MKNILKGLLGIVAIIAAVALLLSIVPNVFNFIKHFGEKDMHPNGIVFDSEEQDRIYKDTASDIDGWSVYDKLQAGLNPEDGSDTDADGLTDKEEIEVYNSDPKKVSTAGDYYSDSYKVENGMDINTYSEYDGEPVYEYNECSEVKLNAKDAYGLKARVNDTSYEDSTFDGYNVYKAYRIYHFNGELSVDISSILKDSNVKENKICMFIADHPGQFTKLEKVKFTKDGNNLKPNYEFNEKGDYALFIAEPNKLFPSKSPKFDITLNGRISAGDIEGVEYIFVHFLPLRNLFGEAKPHLYYVPSGNKEIDDNVIHYLMNLSREVTDGYAGLILDEDVKAVNKVSMKALKAFLAPVANICRFESMADLASPASPTFKWTFVLAEYNDTFIDDVEYKEAVVSDVVSHSNVGFEILKDELPFENFGTEYSVGGNCSGIAYYTAKLFNEKTVNATGEYSTDRFDNGIGSVSWDISNDEENMTLLDDYIADYKDIDFVKNHSDKNGILINLSDGENEFIKMIGAYWGETNDHIGHRSYMYPENSDTGYVSWEMIDEMKVYLNQGKILVLGLKDSDGYGHTVNIVGYSERKDTVTFYIYDNNFARNHKSGNSLIQPLLVVNKEYCEKGYKESFTFSYKPFETCKYEYSSENNPDGLAYFVVMDSNFKVLNDYYNENFPK